MEWRSSLSGFCMLVGAAGCAGARPAPSTAQTDAEQLYEDRCGRCHDAVPPHGYLPAQWPAIVQRMRAEARLTDAETRRILGWLQEGRR